MAISERQLEAWANQGGTTAAQATHERIRRALETHKHLIRRGDWEIYLQGSYRNATNIRGDSDVDIVVQLNSAFYSNKLSLPTDQYLAFEAAYPGDAGYCWADFRGDVLSALRAEFRSPAIIEGNNSLVVRHGTDLQADVVPALLYRNYKAFWTIDNAPHDEGMTFWRRDDNQQVINYPKLHFANGVTKNDPNNTNGWFKPTVRLFKNARNAAIDAKIIQPNLAPSYFVECMLCNVPKNYFGGSYGEEFVGIINWLRSANTGSFMSQNGVIPLFGATRQQWSVDSMYLLLSGLIHLWNSR